MEQGECKIEYIAVNSTQVVIKEFLEELYVEQYEEDTNYIAGSGADFNITVKWEELPSENIFLITSSGETESGLNEFKKMFETIGDTYFEFIFLTYSSVGERRCKDGYERLHALENELRTFILKTLMLKHGHAWWEETVPETVRQKKWNSPKELKQKELNSRLYDSETMQHLIHYTNFGDLKKIIEDDKNWNAIFEPEFGGQGIIYKLGELEPIRNKIAHNRYLTEENEAALKFYYGQIHRFVLGE
jgi:hypothetical protein